MRVSLTIAVCCLPVALMLAGCGRSDVQAKTESPAADADVSVGVVTIKEMPLARDLTMSAELVPFQEIEVYAKESGYVKQLLVDYGTHVKAGQLLAVLEIPELELQLQQDDAAIKSAADQATHAEHEVTRQDAQRNVLHLQAERLSSVAKTQAGLVAQQEVDDATGKDLAAAAQVESAQSNLAAMQGQVEAAKAKRMHDQALYDYAKITAPFAGVVTQRYANLGTLMQAGTSSTQALPLVRLSQDNLFRLVIPVPESYVRYVKVGDPVKVNVAALGRAYEGKVARFSVDVSEDTRTMHTEVDVPNTDGKLLPGLYADATVALDQKQNAVAVPLQAVSQNNGTATVYVVDGAHKIENRTLKLGIQTENEAEVLSGLAAGEQVVVGDRSSLKPGQHVTPQTVQLVQYQEDQK